MKSRKLFISLMILALAVLVFTACEVMEKGHYTLNIVVTGEGKVGIAGEDLIEEGEIVRIYEYGKVVQIEVEPEEGYEVSWAGPDGDKVEKDGNNYKVRIIGDMKISANFIREGSATDNALFNFEEDTEGFGWSVAYGGDDSTVNAKLSNSTEIVYAGKQSLKIDYHFTSTGASNIDIFKENLNSDNYGVYKFRVYVPEESGLEFFQAFVQTTAWDWNSESPEAIEYDKWIELEVDMRENPNKGVQEIYKLGIQIAPPSNPEKLSGTIYIDSIDVVE